MVVKFHPHALLHISSRFLNVSSRLIKNVLTLFECVLMLSYLCLKVKRLQPFWQHVDVSVDIDLSDFDLPDGKRSLEFKFSDPVWAWVRAAYKQPASEMQWVPKVQCTRGLENHVCYGGGLQFGEAFAEACRSCPEGTRPMLISLHWDGSHAYGLHATPICVGVGNTNSVSSSTQYCIGYMPVISDLGANFTSQGTELKHYIKLRSNFKHIKTCSQVGIKTQTSSPVPGGCDR